MKSISQELIENVAYELNRRAAISLPGDIIQALKQGCQRESKPMARYVLGQILDNANIAVEDGRAICADTGLPRFYVKAGNEAIIEKGFVALEGSLRHATSRATRDFQLRANRVHPLTRHNPGNNVGIHAPSVDYSFEPDANWLELTAVHKGGLFGSDYRMLFPGDGTDGIKRFFLDCISMFGHRGLSCTPVVVGIGIGGAKDQCVRLGKEACSLRVIGDRHPEPEVAQLEEELIQLGNRTGFGVMGLPGDVSVFDVHIELAYAHTGGLPVAISQFCNTLRRATARIYPGGQVDYRDDPRWFTPYYRRTGIE
ncbi:fumarate hydratase [Chloroflexota bacterium]